jgi:hypothetical protein
MLAWIDTLAWPKVDVAQAMLPILRSYWGAGVRSDLGSISQALWHWVDANGGPRMSIEKEMILVRMLLCLTSDDNRELQDMGFFEDLLALYGLARAEINQYGPSNPPQGGEVAR